MFNIIRGNQVTSHHTLPLHKKISINQLGISFMSVCICIQVTHYYVFITKSRRIQEEWHVPTLEKPGSQVSSPRNRKELQYLAEGFENCNRTGFHSMLFWCFGGLLRTGIRMDFAARIQEKILPKQKTKPRVKTNSVKNYWGQTHHVVPSWYESKISQKKGLGNIFVWRQAHMKSWRYQLSSVQRFLTDHLKWVLSLQCGYAYIYI